MNNGSENYPNFVGVGGHKCGSTWLSECLRDHPEVYMSNPKEIGFFGQNFTKGLAWYLGFYEGVKGQRAIGEFTSIYLHQDQVPERIRSLIG
ncbi:MAG: hypothetical protein AAFO02_15215, partial [Bacteroidota bacterium]